MCRPRRYKGKVKLPINYDGMRQVVCVARVTHQCQVCEVLILNQRLPIGVQRSLLQIGEHEEEVDAKPRETDRSG